MQAPDGFGAPWLVHDDIGIWLHFASTLLCTGLLLLGVLLRWSRGEALGDFVLHAAVLNGLVGGYGLWGLGAATLPPFAQPASHADIAGILLLVSCASRLALGLLCVFLLNLHLCVPARRRDKGDGLSAPLLVAEEGEPADVEEDAAGEQHNSSESPLDAAAFMSRTFFLWVGPLMSLGFSRPLEAGDLPPLPYAQRCAQIRQRIAAAREAEVRSAVARGRQPRWWRVLVRAFWPTIASSALMKLVYDTMQLQGPLLLSALISYLTAATGPGPGAAPLSTGLAWVALLLGLSLLQTVILHGYFLRVFQLGQDLRSATILALYDKTCAVSLSACQAQGAGTLTNLVSTDAKRLQDLTSYCVLLVSAPWQILLFTGLLYTQIGVSMFAGVGVMVAFMPLSGLISRASKQLQSRLMKMKDKRVAATTEAIAGIRLVKANAYEPFFQSRVEAARAEEVAALRKYTYLQQASSVLWSGLPLLVSLASFTAFVLLGNALTAQRVFSALATFTLLRFPMSMLPQVINTLLEAQVAFKRLQSYFDLPEVDPTAVTRLPPAVSEGAVAVSIANGTFSWGSPSPKADSTHAAAGNAPESASEQAAWQLRDINLQVKRGQLVAVVGPVGGGKSALLHALLGQMHRDSGSVTVCGGVAYVAQTPFILNDTLRHNILFGAPYDAARYGAVLDACALRRDLAALPAGDATEIGEKGINLSGGQKARISLARACYQAPSCDVYLLDDVLAAVDAHVGAHIYTHVMLGLLRDKTRVLVTHGLQYLAAADAIAVLSGGRIVQQGPAATILAHVQAASSPTAATAATAAASAGGDGSAAAGADVLRSLFAAYRDAAASLATAAAATTTTTTADGRSGPTVAAPAPAPADATDGLQESKDAPRCDGDAAAALPSAGAAEAVPGAATQQEAVTRVTNAVAAAPAAKPATATDGSGKLTKAEWRQRGRVKAAVFAAYARSNGGWLVVVAITALYALYTAAMQASSWWLSWWSSNTNDATPPEKNQEYLGIYAAISLSSIVVLIVLRVSQAEAGIRAAQRLHDALLANLLRQPQSFFDTTPSGRIINRCSQDIYTLDEQLPATWASFASNLFTVAGVILLIAFVTPWFTLAVVPIAAVYLYTQRYYVTTSRELQRLDSLSKSPLFSHIGTTVNGLSTLRAFAVLPRFQAQAAALLEANQRAYFCNLAANRWLAVRVESVGAMLVSGAALVAVLGRQSGGPSFPALAGLSVSAALSVTQTLNWLVRMSSDLETQMVSVERVNEYIALPREPDEPGADDEPAVTPVTPPPDWPAHGAITIRDLRAKYRKDTPYVLHGVSMDIPAGSHVGLVGRTGSSKSTLINALLRTLDVQEGRIAIDGVDTAAVPRSLLRSRITLIPQEPFLFTASIRRNLDPLGRETDASLWRVLALCDMRTAVERCGGLEAAVAEGGANFSAGERALLSIARALLRRTRVLLVDEATAATDSASDARIQAAFRSTLGDVTTLTVAHRLHTILGSDNVLVMEAGRLVEQGTPAALQAQPDSRFAKLLQQSAASGTGVLAE